MAGIRGLNFGTQQAFADGFDDTEPIRSELFGAERLEQFAGEIAEQHLGAVKPKRFRKLLPRLEENAEILLDAYLSLTGAIRKDIAISPAAEWLVDNFHIVEVQLREIREDLPKGYYKQLPKLPGGEFAGLPRIYAVAISLMSHTDSRFDREMLERFLTAYQAVCPLTIGELWAVAISLRLALVENLRRLCVLITSSLFERESADVFANELLEFATRRPEKVVEYMADKLEGRGPLGQSFIVQLVRQLRDQDVTVTPAVEWLDAHIQKDGRTTESVVQTEFHGQASAQVTVGNIIGSMRLLSTLDWRDFFESISLIDRQLAAEPANVYSRMTFQTRDRYREVIERIARRTGTDELVVGKAVVDLANAAFSSDPSDHRRAHVGYYLIDGGVALLEKKFGYRPRLVEWLKRTVLKHPTGIYVGLFSFLTLMIVALFVLLTLAHGAGLPIIAVFTIVSIIPASDLAMSVLNWDLTILIPPRILPQIDMSTGVTPDAKTIVVMPVLLADEASVAGLLERLEVDHLANNDANIYYALLSDLKDADTETLDEDEQLLETAMGGIEELNKKYSAGGDDRFHLFHRRRLWNPGEAKWMGWERKRGKLFEFNRLLRGANDTSFAIATAGHPLMSEIKYVITLDSDTRLPRDSAFKLIGIAKHPLNLPEIDRSSGRVIKGYGILQPRVSISLDSATASRFARAFSGNTGFDPYTTASSDVYQDVFGEGIFTGKGLYDVDAFQTAITGRVGENVLLSHDLFEGLFARCGLVTDVELIDDFPVGYQSFASRAHRWVRGDWQIARWVFGRVRNGAGQKVVNDLPLISRWKILDNLRRSLVPATLFVWLILVWTVVPGPPAVWTLFTIFALAFPVYANLTANLMTHPKGVPWTSHIRNVWSNIGSNATQVFQLVVYLPHRAHFDIDAILRTLYRMAISRRNLLEWKTSAQSEIESMPDLWSYLRFMWIGPILAVTSILLISVVRPGALPAAGLFLVLWLLSPLVAYLFSRETPPVVRSLSSDELGEARHIARRTWRFFETFVLAEDNWLPPDNYQVEPVPKIEHRTSPTNIGLFLLASVSAFDLGYIGTFEFINRLGLTFATLEKLDKFRGHFFNWYDTRSLQTLSPRYISTVDSGNIAGHLIAVKQALLSLRSRPLLDQRIWKGLQDTLEMLALESKRSGAARRRTAAISSRQLVAEIDGCRELVDRSLDDEPVRWLDLIGQALKRAETIADITNALRQEHGQDELTELSYWSAEFVHQVRSHHHDLNTFFTAMEPQLADARPGGLALGQHHAQTGGFGTGDAAPPYDPTVKLVLTDLIAGTGQPSNIYSGTYTADTAASERIRSDGVDASVSANGPADTVQQVAALRSEIERLADRCETIVKEMDFKFLLDKDRKVFVIGYNVENEKSDNSFYDLLASEARLASFVAIAKGDVQQEHWFRLGRGLAPVGLSRALVSWTATMFEYLMPLLVMRNYEDTILDQTYRAVVRRQIEYGAKHGVPWGISESAYNSRDLQFNYQYEAFGIPGLGLKRGLSQNLVISPYSTALAALVSPGKAFDNFRALAREGAMTKYGFYESIDYTPGRLPPDEKKAVVKAYMAHHQAMILVAMCELINPASMPDYFHADRAVQATELLLQERIPQGVQARHPRAEEVLSSRVVHSLFGRVTRVFDTPDLPTPRTQILSNGKYSVMVTTSGSGYSVCDGMAVTRWREDTTKDPWGSYIYLRDLERKKIWSAGYQPMATPPLFYEVLFSEDKTVITRRDGGILTRTEIVVSPEDNAEIRRVSLSNQSSVAREIEVTSYAEIVLAPPAADVAHPAFSNLFIETYFVPAKDSLIAQRRPRAATDRKLWAVHTVSTAAETIGATQYETDRSRFLGRGHNPSNPAAIIEDRPLSNTAGAVLDPIFSLRKTVRIEPHRTVEICFTTAVTDDEADTLRLADKYHGTNIFERESALAWTKSQVEMRHLGIEPEDAYLFQRLASRILYSDPSLRPGPNVLALNSRTQADLWPHGISGDTPIVLARIGRAEDVASIRLLLKAHEYLRLKGLIFDLVILNEDPSGYIQSLHDELLQAVRVSAESQVLDKNGGVFIKRVDQMSEDDRILLHTVARAVIVTERGTIEELLVRRPVDPDIPDDIVPRVSKRNYPAPMPPAPDLLFFNGLGGFSRDGNEYVTVLGEGQWTPAPWLNVIANEHAFGFQVSETGSGFTWSQNSRENRLSPWSNDAVSDPPGEVIYLRDEDTGELWTPTPLPVRETEPYVIRHGQGYTVFEHTSHGIAQTLTLFVARDAPVKFSLLTLQNNSQRKRRIAVVSYTEFVLGTTRDRSAPYIITEEQQDKGAVFARNPYNNEFAGAVAFVATDGRVRSASGDRKAFIGRNGTLTNPAALRRTDLIGRFGAGLDPCGALHTVVELEPGETREIVILLGEAATRDEANGLIEKYGSAAQAKLSLADMRAYWDDLLGTVEIKTPDTALDTIHNRWLLYQTMVCRIWARSAFYQSGGAFGFRDQLQDVMAIVYADPATARDQILTAAARQFEAGDVQHWWHPPTGRGVRTHFSDDLLWLPFVISFYISVTGDSSILDESVPFIEAPVLAPGQDEAYLLPVVSERTASIFEHCVLAIDHSLKFGEHGLPLMGTGDWNDGMNAVGREGKGESVWLGWFLLKTLEDFAALSGRDTRRRRKYRDQAAKLRVALNTEAWDGDWYRRAYFDDGTPLGSSVNTECRIDSIAQSWCVIAGGDDPHKSVRAMASVDEYLIRRGDGIVLLFTPPFDKGDLEPGYIKGYLPGVRENGGQYTHAALWTLIAFAKLGDGDRAGELLSVLNPINHASTRAGLHRYKVEPYVTAGDVYAEPQHMGRGGWTWYTGSASWMYRAALESMLGFELRGDSLSIDPCIPRGWKGFEIKYRRAGTTYLITVENPLSLSRGVAETRLDGAILSSPAIALVDDGKTHNINVRLGPTSPDA